LLLLSKNIESLKGKLAIQGSMLKRKWPLRLV